MECVTKMKSPGMLHVFVSEAINYALENTSECRQLVGQLFHQLLQNGTLAMERMVAGCVGVGGGSVCVCVGGGGSVCVYVCVCVCVKCGCSCGYRFTVHDIFVC